MASSHIAILLTLLSFGAAAQDAVGAKEDVSLPDANISHPLGLECYACTTIADAAAAGGCSLAVASALECGPASLLCGALFGKICQDVYDYMTENGKSAEEACAYEGYCGDDCQCGTCTSDVADPKTGRSLGFGLRRDARKGLSQTPKLPTAVFEKNGSVAKCDGSQDNYGFCLTCTTNQTDTIVV